MKLLPIVKYWLEDVAQAISDLWFDMTYHPTYDDDDPI